MSAPADPPVPVDARHAVADAFRDEWGRVLATLIGFTGDWDLAEECTQDAFAFSYRSMCMCSNFHPCSEEGTKAPRWRVVMLLRM